MNLFKSFATISGLTLLSRITGLLREILVAKAFGASDLTDAFNVAFRLPNLLRRLFAEGAFSQAFVPILSEYKHKHGLEPMQSLINHVAVVLFWSLLLTIIAGILGAPYLVNLMASGFAQKGALFEQTVQLTRIMFPYIGFMSFVAMASGILNIFGKFALPAFTPLLLNISFIVVALLFNQNIEALAWAVIIGGLLQLSLQLYGLAKLGILPKWHLLFKIGFSKAWHSEGVKRILLQMLPAILAVSVTQISLIINTNIASHLQVGSVSWLSYADRLMEFPTALLGVALSTILMPTLSKAAQQHNQAQYSKLLDWGLQMVLLMAIPASLALWFFATPLCATLFHYGKFTNLDVQMTCNALQSYGIGLIGLIAVKILAPGFYAKQDIKTPVKIGLGILCATQLMNYFFVPSMQHAGLALSIGLGACLNALCLLIGLQYKKIYKTQTNWLIFIIKLSVAALISTYCMYYFSNAINWLDLKQQALLRFGYLIGCLMVIVGVYVLVLQIMGVKLKKYLSMKFE